MNLTNILRRTVLTGAVTATLALGFAGSSAQAASGAVGPHSAAVATCASPEIRSTAPTVKAVNSTTAVDSQWVVVQPVLYKWNGSGWVTNTTYAAIMGLATDTSSPTVWYDFATRTTTQPSLVGLMTSSGSYRLAYNYYWYKGNVVSGSDSLWATMTSPIGAVLSYCTR